MSKEESAVLVIENVIEALNDIRYEMETFFNAEEGFSVQYLNQYISNAEKGLNDIINSVDGGVE